MARPVVAARRRSGGPSQLPALTPLHGALVLVGLCIVCTALFAHAVGLRTWLVIGAWTWPGVQLPGLVTSTFVAPPAGPFSLLLLAALVVMVYLQPLKALWARRPMPLVAALAGGVAALWLVDRFVVPGLGYGLAGAVLVLGWVGTGVERRWGAQRLLGFAAIIVLTTNALGATLAYAAGAGVMQGERPLSFALLTVWCLMNAHGIIAGTRIAMGKLIWVLVAFGVLDTILVGWIEGLMELAAIGLAWVVVHGYHRPRHAIDRFKLWRLERRRRSMRVIDGGRLHRPRSGGAGA
jgi:hypothetical protein